MDKQTCIISFGKVSEAERGVCAAELRDMLLDADGSLKVDTRRADPNRQDPGGILEIVLNASAVVGLVTTLGVWLKMRRSASITIKTPDGKVIAKNITAKDAADLADKFLKKIAANNNKESANSVASVSP